MTQLASYLVPSLIGLASLVSGRCVPLELGHATKRRLRQRS
jgi:hypothetical protein